MGCENNLFYKQTFKKKYIFAASKQALDQWCKGSTPGFGSVGLGSNPGWSTLQNSHYYKVRVFFGRK